MKLTNCASQSLRGRKIPAAISASGLLQLCKKCRAVHQKTGLMVIWRTVTGKWETYWERYWQDVNHDE